MTRGLAEYVVKGRKQAIIAALLFTLVPFLGWIGTAILALVTLRKGPLEGSIILLWVALPAVVLAAFGSTGPLMEDVVYTDLLVWFLAVGLRRTASWSFIIQGACFAAIVIVLIAHAVNPNLVIHWEQFLTASFDEMQRVGSGIVPKFADLKSAIKIMATMATGVQAVLIITSALFILFFARWWQAMLYHPTGLYEELYQLRIWRVTGSALFIVVLLMAGKVSISWDIFPLLMLPCLIAGLSLVHFLLKSVKAQWWWYGGFYLLMIPLFPQIATLLLILAVIDSWMNLRNRIQLGKECFKKK